MSTEFLKDFGMRIKNLRIDKGMTQDELAQKVGYTSRSSINKIELGLVDIPQSKIVAIADALNTTPAYLMGWKDNPEKDTPPPLEIPDRYKDLMVAFNGGGEDLTQEDINAVIRFVEFLKNNKK